MHVTYHQAGNGRYPVKDFLDTLPPDNQSKVFAYFEMLSIAGGKLRGPYSKHLTDGIFELRPSRNNIFPRILYFFDQESAILTNGFLKKSQKTPLSEISRAKKLRNEYYAQKG